jgi:hypothetical protein
MPTGFVSTRFGRRDRGHGRRCKRRARLAEDLGIIHRYESRDCTSTLICARSCFPRRMSDPDSKRALYGIRPCEVPMTANSIPPVTMVATKHVAAS